jgi:soluble lytic murein transglycosylase-like protein
MSESRGGLPREERLVLPRSAGVMDFGRSVEVARRAVSEQGQIAGVLDPIARALEQERVEQARVSGELAAAAEPIQRDENGRIIVPDLSRGPFERIAEQRRREILTSRYASEFLLDSQRSLQQLHNQHLNDPEAFRQAAERWRQGTVAALPPELRVEVDQGIGRLIGQHYGRLMTQKATRDREEARRLADQALEQLYRDAYDLVLQGRDPTPVLNSIRAKLAQDTGPVWDRGEAAERERRLTVLGPLQAQLQRQVRFGGIALLLGDGPERFGSRLPEEWRPIIADAARQTGLPERLLRELIGLESGGDANALSRAGALGPAQIMPGTARSPGFGLEPLPEEDRNKPERAIPWAARYLRALLDRYGGDYRLALAAYNAGPGRVDEHLRTGRPLPDETQRYIANLMPGAGSGPNGTLDSVEAGRLVEALRSGPGSPGWREEWSVLTQEERRALAQYADALIREHRQEVNWQEARLRLAAEQVRAQRRYELELLEQQRRPDGTLPPDALTRRQQIEEELKRLGDLIGADWGADVARQARERDRAAVSEAAQEAVMRYRLGRALEALGVSPETPATGDTAQLLSRISSLPLAAQKEILELFVRDREQALRELRQRAERWRRFAAAMLPGEQQGPQVENSREYQEIALEWIRGPNQQIPFTDPAAQLRIVQAARAGVLPEQVVGFMLGALQSGDPRAYAAAAALHRALESEPQARRVYHAQMDERSRTAFAGVAEQLASIPAEGFEQRVQPLIEQSRRIARADPQLTQEILQQLGPTEQEQRQALRELLEGALREHAGSWLGRNIEGILAPSGWITTIPPEMERQFNARLLSLMAIIPDRQVAARQALRELVQSGEWGLSRYGLPVGGALALPQGIFAGVQDALFGGARRWVRNPPEHFVAPYGRGGEVSARWQEQMVQDVLRRHGVPEAERRRWVLGETAFLRPTDQFEVVEVEGVGPVSARLYEIWGPVAPGVINYLGAMGPDGVRTAAPVRVPLQAEALRHQARWRNAELERQRASREERNRMEGELPAFGGMAP